MTIYYLLLAVAVIIIALVLTMVVITMKNVKKEETAKTTTEKEDDFHWNHIKDFAEINSENSGKLNGFDESYDEDVMTSGIIVPIKPQTKKVNSEPEFQNKISSTKNSAKNLPDLDKIESNNESRAKSSAAAGGGNKSTADERIDISSEESELEFMPTEMMQTEIMSVGETVIEPKASINVILNFSDGENNKVMKMSSDTLTVGREPGNDIILWNNCYLSRWHAVFSIKENKLFLKDLKSKNGTYVDGKRIVDEVELTKDCDVKFGNTIIHVKIAK